jgi:hypothetical protein
MSISGEFADLLHKVGVSERFLSPSNATLLAERISLGTVWGRTDQPANGAHVSILPAWGSAARTNPAIRRDPD